MLIDSLIDAVGTALADNGLTGTEIGHLLRICKRWEILDPASPNLSITKWKRLHECFSSKQNAARERTAILQIQFEKQWHLPFTSQTMTATTVCDIDSNQLSFLPVFNALRKASWK